MRRMRNIVGIILGMLLLANVSYGQRYATASGNWNDPIWATTPGGVAGSAATPTATDDVYTNGQIVTVSPATVTCRNLFVSYNVAGSLVFPSLRRIIVTGALSGWDDLNGYEEFPVASVLTFAAGSSLEFTGANLSGTGYEPYVIFFWDESVPLGRVTFNFGTGNTFNTVIPLQFGAVVNISSGTLITDPGSNLYGSASTSLTVNPGASLITDDPLGPFGTITVNGTLQSSSTINSTNLTVNGTLTTVGATSLSGTFTVNTGSTVNLSGSVTANNTTLNGSLTTSNFLNTTNSFVLASGQTFSTSYNGTEGWWLTTNSPNSTTLNGTVNYSRNGVQNVAPENYTNLTISGSGVKTSTGSGLQISGDLLVSAGTFTSASGAAFDGTDAQSISGAGTVNFNGGLTVNKTGTLTLSKDISIQNGLTVSQGIVNASNQIINLSGNLANSGTLNFGTGGSLGTLNVNGPSTSVSGSSTTNFGNLSILSGTFSSAGTVNVAGDLSNGGTFNVNSVNFNGTSAQAISGTLGLTNITISDGADVTNNGIINLTGVATLTGASSFYAGTGSGSNFFRLISSNLSTTARIAPLPDPNNFTGNVTIQRFIDAPEGWRYLSMPLNTNNNVGQWRDDISVTGNFSDASTSVENPNVVSSSAASIYRWDAPTQAWSAITGNGNPTSSTTLSNSVGYSLWTYISSNQVISMTGNIVKGPKNITLSAGDNLIPNPYPSAIDWDNIRDNGGLSGANLVTNTVYVRVSDGVFASYTSGVGTGHPDGNWAGQLALGQAFWVIANGPGTISMNESSKTSSYRYVRTEDAKDYIRLRLKGNGQEDDIVVRFHEQATLDTDIEWDGVKHKNGDYSLNLERYNHINLSSYTVDESKQYAINSVPLLTCQYNLSLAVEDAPVGNYTLGFEDFDKLTLGYHIRLIDTYLEKDVKVEEGFEYAFTINEDAASWGSGRFQLAFSEPVPSITTDGNVLLSSSLKGNQWYKDGVLMVGETSDKLVVTESGAYSVKVVNGDCGLTSDEIPFLVTDIDKQYLGGIKVHPNPVNDLLTIAFPQEIIPQIRNLAIFDLQGRVVYMMDDASKIKNGELNVDFSANQSGLYLVRISTTAKAYALKVIKN